MTMAESTFVTPVELDRDSFMRRLIASLGHLNEAILGSDIAGAYVMNVGLSMGAAIEAEYKRFWGIDRPFTLDEYAHVIVDLKQKIQGNFSLVSKAVEKVVVRTTSCPFDAFVRESPALCFMTSSVFGGIAARNFGWAKVVLHQRIALGDPGCYVTVHLRRTPEADSAIGREYAPNVDLASPDIGEQLRLMDSVRQLRHQLGETSSRWEEVVRGAAEAICVLGVDSRVLFANARWRDLLGVEGAELVGGALLPVIHPDDEEHARDCLARAGAGERITACACRLRHRAGNYQEVLISVGPVRDDHGRITGVLAIVRDVTQERQAQRLRDEFVSAASHELRTPVTTIRAITDLLLRTLDRDEAIAPEQLGRRLQMIRSEADRLALLATDLLDATRLQAGKLRIRQQPQDLRTIVEESVQRQRALLDGPGGYMLTVVHPPAPILVQVDRARVEQVLSNLLGNAVKYSPEGGRIRVEVAAEGETALIRVTDEGIGIPEADQEQVFTPFYRASNVSTRNYSGLGLGLYVSKALIEAHGGDITVQASGPRGTTVTVSLPRA